MSKVVGLVGSASGKLGNVVYSVVNGVQTARVYQPVVANPKSQGQRLQRAKVNLVGQVSAITPWQILSGLGVNRRARRARFLRLAMQKVTSGPAAGDTNTINAKLAAEDFIFSEGAITPTMTVVNVNAAIQSVSLTLNRMGGVTDAEFNASGLLVVVVLKAASGVYESVLYRFVSSDELTGGTFTVSLPHIAEGRYFADVYCAPFRTDDGTSLRARAEELFGDSTDFNANMSYSPSAVPLLWGKSVLIQSAEFNPAP